MTSSDERKAREAMQRDEVRYYSQHTRFVQAVIFQDSIVDVEKKTNQPLKPYP
jgi:hypothetical protein